MDAISQGRQGRAGRTGPCDTGRAAIATHAGAEPVELLPERAVWWPAAATLLVADLHWGKSEAFWAAGAPVPGGVLEADLARLSAAIAAPGAQRLIVLGDILHADDGLTPGMIERVCDWRSGPARGLEVWVVPGNHDRALDRVAGPWGLTVRRGEVREGPFAFRHEPAEEDGCFTWAGHLHPMGVLRGRTDAVRLPCFWMSARGGVLPAFSAFTRGLTIAPAENERLYAVAGERVVAVGATPVEFAAVLRSPPGTGALGYP
jgi:DNA ligase-associated metallophosphoesterase